MNYEARKEYQFQGEQFTKGDDECRGFRSGLASCMFTVFAARLPLPQRMLHERHITDGILARSVKIVIGTVPPATSMSWRSRQGRGPARCVLCSGRSDPRKLAFATVIYARASKKAAVSGSQWPVSGRVNLD
jgi:hypothetical protein